MRTHRSVHVLRFSTGNAGNPLFRFRDGRHLTKSVFVEEVCHLLQAAAVPNVKEYQGHSFRIGAATSAAVAGVPEWQIRALDEGGATWCCATSEQTPPV